VNDNVTKIAIVLIGLIIILVVAVAMLINNTLRIALFSQRFLIRSMQLVGAKKWFIQRPFLLRAAGYGILSGLIAAGIIWAITDYAQKKISDLKVLHDDKQFMMLIGGLLIVGVVIAVVSTYLSIRRYLRMSLEELY